MPNAFHDEQGVAQSCNIHNATRTLEIRMQCRDETAHGYAACALGMHRLDRVRPISADASCAMKLQHARTTFDDRP